MLLLQDPLPPVSLWEQFYVLGVLALFILFLSVIGYKAFMIFREWQEEQDEKRDAAQKERDKTQAENQKQRDERLQQFQVSREEKWQRFIGDINKCTTDSLDNLSKQIAAMITSQQAILSLLQEHDKFVKENNRKDQK